jgi:hypothetical protein
MRRSVCARRLFWVQVVKGAFFCHAQITASVALAAQLAPGRAARGRAACGRFSAIVVDAVALCAKAYRARRVRLAYYPPGAVSGSVNAAEGCAHPYRVVLFACRARTTTDVSPAIG